MSKFTWGDTVRVTKNAPHNFEPGKIGSVCSVDLIETEIRAEQTGAEIGGYCHVVEWTDGSDIEIPAKWLEKV
ncbi:MAG: hypothetical protein AAGA72_14675 [Pseudomonadota bacterium]